ncbi:MAG TPA: nicotinamide mononucleotide transporter [Dissulfurispiraceae bacterium]|nr:nicotinamide mononucleotide transporter [Dissulfurispiraceae bacterium]
MMLELIGAIAAALAVAGVLLNNRMRRECFVLWMISNGLSLLLHLEAGMWALSVRDVIFFALAIDGWRRWGKRQRETLLERAIREQPEVRPFDAEEWAKQEPLEDMELFDNEQTERTK